MHAIERYGVSALRSAMKLLGLAGLLALAAGGLCARAATWQPSAGHQQIPIWPGTPPDATILARP